VYKDNIQILSIKKISQKSLIKEKNTINVQKIMCLYRIGFLNQLHLHLLIGFSLKFNLKSTKSIFFSSCVLFSFIFFFITSKSSGSVGISNSSSSTYGSGIGGL